MFKLRDWPFGPDELATIRWIKSPFNDDKNGWVLPVVFEGSKGRIAQINTSWGSLVLMRFGQIYKGGIPFESCKDGSIVALEVSDPSEGRFCKASKVNPFLPGSMTDLVSESCWRFENDGTIIFIPCIEIVRCFLAPNVIMANALLTPYGLNDIVTSTANGDLLSLRFDNTVPRKIIRDSFVQYLAWLKTNESASEAWSSVYRELMPKGAIGETGKVPLFDESGGLFPGDKRLQVKFPVQGSCRLHARVLKNANRMFVLEIVGVTGLSLPVERVSISHISFKHKRNILTDLHVRPKRVGRIRKKEKREIELVSGNPNSARMTQNIDITPTYIGFNERIILSQICQESTRLRRNRDNNSHNQPSKRERREAEKRAYQEKLRKKNYEQHMDDGEYESEKETGYSAGEIYFDGNSGVKSLEVHGLRAINSPYGNGLDTFFKTLSVLELLDDSLKIEGPKIMLLPGGRGFAVKREDSTPRQYVWVPVEHKTPIQSFVYILEVERSPNTHLSTLLLWPREGRSFKEDDQKDLIEGLLAGLLRNSGHWDRTDIKSNRVARIVTLKHWDNWEPSDWAEIIFSKIG